MKRFSRLALASVLMVAACRRQEPPPPSETTMPMMETTATTPASGPYDLQFIDSMTRHHQMAINMAKMAEPNFAHKELKEAARKIVDDQQAEIERLKSWRDQWYPGAASAENMQMPGMSSISMDMSHMQTMSGNQLDLMFIDMMVPHHQGAVELANDALAKAEHAEIKDLAREIVAKQTREIEQLQQWKNAWS